MRFRTGFLILLGIAGCGDPSPPTVSFTVQPNIVARGGTVTLHVTTTDFELVEPHPETSALIRETVHGLRPQHEDATGVPLVADSGHYHVYLDSDEVNPLLQSYKSEVTLTVPSATSLGAHELILRLSAEDHRTLVPHVEDTQSIEVTD